MSFNNYSFDSIQATHKRYASFKDWARASRNWNSKYRHRLIRIRKNNLPQKPSLQTSPFGDFFDQNYVEKIPYVQPISFYCKTRLLTAVSERKRVFEDKLNVLTVLPCSNQQRILSKTQKKVIQEKAMNSSFGVQTHF